ncbi:maleate cis-trans isomerase family protein [Bradyrhizobium sp.]|jgi:maleate isomerase|uniref:maleate cis-trans isomerase family protein n=1 Tax=Bradyrhizobium sp. TaxID=376 RepID=UPI003C1CDC68
MPTHIKTLIVVPENNSTMEPEISALCPALAPLAVARVKRPPRTLLLEDLPAYAGATLDAVAPFTSERWDLLIYGCTAAGFLGGPGSNAVMVESLRERTGAPVVSTAGAVVDVLREGKVAETAVVTPYLQPVNDGLRAYLEASGIRVETLNSFFCKTTAELGSVTEEEVLDLARRTVTKQSKSLFLACSQLPTLNAIAQLRRELDIPVWSSIQATAWASARAMISNGFEVRTT